VQSADVKERFATMGLEPVSNSPEDMMKFLRAEQVRYGDIARRANIRVE
jgi:tripartite-type tricarboxylate transporter receptor subunit TctC